MEELIVKLYAIGAIKFGNFEIKKNFLSPFQIDLTRIISHPQISKEICHLLWDKMIHLSFDLICGIPPTASCLATYLAWDQNLSLVAFGEKNIQGMYKTGQKCLVLQDLLLSGTETLDAIECLEEGGIVIRDVLIFFDLGLGAKKKIKERSYVPHALIGMPEMLQILFDANKITGDNYKLASDFLENV